MTRGPHFRRARGRYRPTSPADIRYCPARRAQDGDVCFPGRSGPEKSMARRHHLTKLARAPYGVGPSNKLTAIKVIDCQKRPPAGPCEVSLNSSCLAGTASRAACSTGGALTTTLECAMQEARIELLQRWRNTRRHPPIPARLLPHRVGPHERVLFSRAPARRLDVRP
jgi:hypothetical protein